ncbi:MAG: aminotransferase class V-fold PLP-dependent enzyme [Deltaproteobacteria bacterium]|nr:aminotransferase class V-fold PLP-dependent enzyme [Deltaproteobacteria bacterium]
MSALAPRALWSLDEDVCFLNHGSFGATPRSVMAAQRRFQDQLEAEPVRFFVRELPGLVRAAAAEIAAFVGADPEGLVFVDNATTGVNAVLASVRLPRDAVVLCLSHVYNAVAQSLHHHGGRGGWRVVHVNLPRAPLTEIGVLSAFDAALARHKPSLVVVDHIVSAAGVVLPIDALVRRAKATGARVLVDAAHTPGQARLNVRELGADWVVGNLHKWLFAPKGAAFLAVAPDQRAELHPTVISHGYRQGLAAEFDFTGTRDVSAWLAAPAGLAFWRSLGGEALMAANQAQARRFRQRLVEAVPGAVAACEEAMVGAMAAIVLPAAFGEPSFARALALHDRLFDEFGVEVPVSFLDGALWLRVSAQAYVEDADLERLINALGQLLR